MTNAETKHNDKYEEYPNFNLNLKLVYMVDDFYELMLVALQDFDNSQNGSVPATEE